MSREPWLNTSDLQRAFDYVDVSIGGLPKILFVCPRQSGKTTALFEMFLNTPDSVFLTPYASQLSRFRNTASLRQLGWPGGRGDNLRPEHDILPFTNSNPLGRGRYRPVSCLYIDDIDGYGGDFDRFLGSTYPYLRPTEDTRKGIMATMTPVGGRSLSYYQEYFSYIRNPFTPTTEPTIDRADFVRADHFEGDLFEV